MLSPMKSPSFTTQKDWEVIIDLGVDEKHVVHAYFRAKVPALAELAAKDKYGSTAPLSKSKNFDRATSPKHQPQQQLRSADAQAPSL